jgi:lipopolysaccharide export LptBFGC system permease protein LptF
MSFMVSLVCLGFNYRWAPAAAAYHEALLEETKMGSLSRARNVVYFTEENRRLWFIGDFPYDYHQGEPLENIIIRSFSENGSPEWRLRAERAEWDRHDNNWTFHGISKWDLTNRLDIKESPIDPKRELQLPDPYVIEAWNETPWQLIKPGLKAEDLGIPGLYSWLVQNRESEWGNKRQFLTQWHYRWAQPGICLAIVLLAAPLGIVFSRRGRSWRYRARNFHLLRYDVFIDCLSLAWRIRILSPLWAAWGTNILATAMALVLIQRRLVGRPIYQTIRTLIPV